MPIVYHRIRIKHTLILHWLHVIRVLPFYLSKPTKIHVCLLHMIISNSNFVNLNYDMSTKYSKMLIEVEYACAYLYIGVNMGAFVRTPTFVLSFRKKNSTVFLWCYFENNWSKVPNLKSWKARKRRHACRWRKYRAKSYLFLRNRLIKPL